MLSNNSLICFHVIASLVFSIMESRSRDLIANVGDNIYQINLEDLALFLVCN